MIFYNPFKKLGIHWKFHFFLSHKFLKKKCKSAVLEMKFFFEKKHKKLIFLIFSNVAKYKIKTRKKLVSHVF